MTGHGRYAAGYGPETFAVRLSDDSMEPLFRSGDFLFVDPDEPAERGRYVGVRDPETGARTVRLLEAEDGRRVLRALAPGWPETALDADNETMISGTAVFHGRGV